MRRYIWNGQNCSCSTYLKELGEVCVVQWDLYTAGLCPESVFGDWLAFQVSSGLRLHWFNSLRRKYVRILNEFVPYRCLEVIGSFGKTCFHWQVNCHGKKKGTISFSEWQEMDAISDVSLLYCNDKRYKNQIVTCAWWMEVTWGHRRSLDPEVPHTPGFGIRPCYTLKPAGWPLGKTKATSAN